MISKTSLYKGEGFSSKNLISSSFISTLKSTTIELFEVVTFFIEYKRFDCFSLFCLLLEEVWADSIFLLFITLILLFKTAYFFSSGLTSLFNFFPSSIIFFKSSIFWLSSFLNEDFKNSILASLYCCSKLEAKDILIISRRQIKNLVKITTLL